MVLQHIQSKQTKQNVATDTDKSSSPNLSNHRGRNTNSSKSVTKNRDRASTVNIRDVNLDDVKMMEPKWRAKKLDKITLVNTDSCCSSQVNDGAAAPRERKFTLQDFIVPSDGGNQLTTCQFGKQLGMTTSEYIVVGKHRSVRRTQNDTATIREDECDKVGDSASTSDAAARSTAEMDYSETLDDDDFVVIDLH